MDKDKNLRLLYLHETFFSLGEGVLGIALPVFLFQYYQAVAPVFLWHLCWSIIYLVCLLPVINHSFTLRQPTHLMVAGLGFYILAMLSLALADSGSDYCVPLSALFFALYVSCYWPVRHWFFSCITDSDQVGKQVSSVFVIRILVGFLAPVLGGLVAYFFGMAAAFALGASVTVVAVIPTLSFSSESPRRSYQLREVIELMQKPEMKAVRSTYLFEGMSHHCTGPVWILIFAIYIGNVGELGVLMGVVALLSALLCRELGKRFDAERRTQLLQATTGIRFVGVLLYASVYFYAGLIFVFFVKMINHIAGLMHGTVVDSYLYGYSNRIHPVEFHINRELCLSGGRILVTACMVVLFNNFSAQMLWPVLLFGAFLMFGWLTLARLDHVLSSS